MHVAIHREEDKYFIEDLGSINGTWLNGEKLSPTEQHELYNGSQVRLGSLYIQMYHFTETSENENGATIAGVPTTDTENA